MAKFKDSLNEEKIFKFKTNIISISDSPIEEDRVLIRHHRLGKESKMDLSIEQAKDVIIGLKKWIKQK